MFFKGVTIGLGLALLVGPLIVLLLQLALREGARAAWLAGLGIWISDLMFVLLAHFGTDYLSRAVAWRGFEPLVSTLGGIVLVAIGLNLYFRRSATTLATEEQPVRKAISPFLAFWQGFAINTFNPFPVFFWSLVALTMVHEPGLKSQQAFSLYAGILTTIVVTDSFKIWSASWLRERLAAGWLEKIGQIGGMLLVVFGVVLGVKGWW